MSAMEGGAVVWDLETGKKLAVLNVRKATRVKEEYEMPRDAPTSPVPHVASISPDGRYLRVTYGGPNQVLWDVDRDKQHKKLPKEQLGRMEGWGPLPDTAILGTSDNRRELVDIRNGRLLAYLLLPEGYGIHHTKIGQGPMTYPTLSNLQGLVLSCFEGDKSGLGGLMGGVREGDPISYFVNWDLRPHLEELKRRMGKAF